MKQQHVNIMKRSSVFLKPGRLRKRPARPRRLSIVPRKKRYGKPRRSASIMVLVRIPLSRTRNRDSYSLVRST